MRINLHKNYESVLKAIDSLIDKYKQGTKGCQGCAFESVEAWEMPCRKCKRNCIDYYWRKPEG